jgi:hypothetical protein
MRGSSYLRLLYAFMMFRLATYIAVNTSYGLEAQIIEDFFC